MRTSLSSSRPSTATAKCLATGRSVWRGERGGGEGEGSEMARKGGAAQQGK